MEVLFHQCKEWKFHLYHVLAEEWISLFCRTSNQHYEQTGPITQFKVSPYKTRNEKLKSTKLAKILKREYSTKELISNNLTYSTQTHQFSSIKPTFASQNKKNWRSLLASPEPHSPASQCPSLRQFY
jgi:hypothetical protein